MRQRLQTPPRGARWVAACARELQLGAQVGATSLADTCQKRWIVRFRSRAMPDLRGRRLNGSVGWCTGGRRLLCGSPVVLGTGHDRPRCRVLNEVQLLPGFPLQHEPGSPHGFEQTDCTPQQDLALLRLLGVTPQSARPRWRAPRPEPVWPSLMQANTLQCRDLDLAPISLFEACRLDRELGRVEHRANGSL